MTEAAGRKELKSLALIFPGQGSQFPGMGADLFRESASARSMMERADELLGYSLSKIMAGDKGDELNRTLYAQPAIFVHSMALLKVMGERHPLVPVTAAGHSLGEYSALCAAGVLDFEETLGIIQVRAKGMDEAQVAGACAMAAIIGLTKERSATLVEECRGEDVLEAANFNAPDQIVISGHREAVARVVEAAGKEKRARAVMLPVSSAFHTPLMEPARKYLGDRLETVVPGKGRFPVVANVNAQPYSFEPAGFRRLLTDQLIRPVLWEACVRTMMKNPVDGFVEVGPGKVLTGLLRRIDKSAVAYNVSDPDSIQALEEALDE